MPWIVSPAARMFIETSIKQRAGGWGLQRYRVSCTNGFSEHRIHEEWGQNVLFLYRKSICVILSLCELHPFFHIFHGSHTSHLWHFWFHCLVNTFFSVHIHHLALSLASSYLLILHYFSHSFVDFSYIFTEHIGTAEFLSFMLYCPPLALQSFFQFVAFPAVHAPLCFSCTQLEIKLGTKDRKVLQFQLWASVVLLHRNRCGPACWLSSPATLTT